jgi:hypothetical protein
VHDPVGCGAKRHNLKQAVDGQPQLCGPAEQRKGLK